MGLNQGLEIRKPCVTQLVGAEAQLDPLSKFLGSSIERQDLLREELGPFLARADLCGDQQRLIDHEKVGIAVIGFVHGQRGDRAGHVLQRDHRVGLAGLF